MSGAEIMTSWLPVVPEGGRKRCLIYLVAPGWLRYTLQEEDFRVESCSLTRPNHFLLRQQLPAGLSSRLHTPGKSLLVFLALI